MGTWNNLTDLFNTNSVIDEMRKKYEGTYLHIVIGSGEEEKTSIARYNGYIDGFHNFTDKYGGHITILHDTDTQVLCKFPRKGLFNFNKRMYYAHSLPHRQYKKGPWKENFAVIDPAIQTLSNKNVLDMKLFEAATWPTYVNIRKVLLHLSEGKVAGYAISRDFGITLAISKYDTSYLVWYHDCLIGHIKDGKMIIQHPNFKQEVMENLDLFTPLEVQFDA